MQTLFYHFSTLVDFLDLIRDCFVKETNNFPKFVHFYLNLPIELKPSLGRTVPWSLSFCNPASHLPNLFCRFVYSYYVYIQYTGIRDTRKIWLKIGRMINYVREYDILLMSRLKRRVQAKNLFKYHL